MTRFGDLALWARTNVFYDVLSEARSEKSLEDYSEHFVDAGVSCLWCVIKFCEDGCSEGVIK